MRITKQGIHPGKRFGKVFALRVNQKQKQRSPSYRFNTLHEDLIYHSPKKRVLYVIPQVA
jgi:hypothetical protein